MLAWVPKLKFHGFYLSVFLPNSSSINSIRSNLLSSRSSAIKFRKLSLSINSSPSTPKVSVSSLITFFASVSLPELVSSLCNCLFNLVRLYWCLSHIPQLKPQQSPRKPLFADTVSHVNNV